MLKKWLMVFCIINFCNLFADDSYWDTDFVRAYVHNSEMQRRWAWSFLAKNLKELKGDEYILDMGCGDGRTTADISKFIPYGFIIGVDPSHAMLDWARKQYSQFDYSNLIFQEGGFLEPNISDQFDIIISNCAFQHCANQNQAVKNFAKLLKQGGKLWIMFPSIDNAAWKKARLLTETSPKWSVYENKIAPRKFPTVDKCLALLKSVNLQPERVEKIETVDPFIDRKEFLNFLIGTFTPAVPKEMAEEFYNDMIDEYLRLLPDALNSNGVIEARFGRIEIKAKKV